MSTATDATLMALGERFEKLLREHMDAWLTWAPRMRAARAEVEDNTASLAVAIQRTGCDVAQARISELERDMQPLAEEIIAAPATSLGGQIAGRIAPQCEANPKGGRSWLLSGCSMHSWSSFCICHYAQTRIIPLSSLSKTSNKIIQKGLAFVRQQSGSVSVP